MEAEPGTAPGRGVEAWGVERLDDLAAIVARTFPDEGLSDDELQSCCWDEPGIVLGLVDGSGAVCLEVDGGVASVKLLAIDPRAGFRAVGRALLDAGESWAWSAGAEELHLGGATPMHLWPGVDVAFGQLVDLVAGAGFELAGRAGTLALATMVRSPLPEGVVLDRPLDDELAEALHDFVTTRWPAWTTAVERAVAQATCLVARSSATGRPVGFAAHSVSREGWIGPLGVDLDARHRGIGRALVGEACRDLMIAGLASAELAPPDAWADAWAGVGDDLAGDESWPTAFFERLGATRSRTYGLWRRARP